MAVVTEPTKWAEALGASADVNEIPSTSQTGASMQSIFPLINSLPIPAGGVAPSRKDINGLLKLLGDSIYYLQHGGKFSYDATFDYAVGNIVMYNNVLYMCITPNGASSTVVSPDSDKTYWYPIINSDPWQNFPTGYQINWLSKSPIPDNWFIMNGQSVSKTTYANLNAFLNSDGSLNDSSDSTKFIIPDMTGRVWQGCSSYDNVLTPLEAGLPNISGSLFDIHAGPTMAGDGAFSIDKLSYQDSIGSTPFTHYYGNINFSAQRYNSYYGASNKPRVDSNQALMIIRA